MDGDRTVSGNSPSFSGAHEVLDALRDAGLLTGAARMAPLPGGVSSDIALVESDRERFVVKRSLARLKVADLWICDTRRTVTEFRAIDYAGRFLPEATPRLLWTDARLHCFAMEFYGAGFQTWKTALLRGDVDLATGVRVARLLAALHRGSWNDAAAADSFAAHDDFHALRLEPYLLTTGRRHPDLASEFQAEVDRLRSTALALVHGDWSPKNLLVSGDRLIILDWEVACFGDPAFDAAFLLNLLYLKSLYNSRDLPRYLELTRVFRATYGRETFPLDADLDRRIRRLTLLLLLARIDGKSPVEYIADPLAKQVVRDFVRDALQRGIDSWNEIEVRWTSAVRAHANQAS